MVPHPQPLVELVRMYPTEADSRGRREPERCSRRVEVGLA